jgi:hypothetical protein
MSTTKAVAIAAPKETELAKLAKTAAALVPKAQAFKVTDAASKAKAIEIIKEIKTRAKLVEDLKAELIAPAKKALDEATKKFTGPAKLYKAGRGRAKARHHRIRRPRKLERRRWPRPQRRARPRKATPTRRTPS